MTPAWTCGTCGHHNPKWRNACRKCRKDRPLGGVTDWRCGR